MRLTERDLELLRWINGHGFVTARQAADWMGTCLQTGHRRMGLLHKEWAMSEGSGCFTVPSEPTGCQL